MTAILADLGKWERFRSGLDPLGPGFAAFSRKIENLRLILERFEEDE